MEQEDDEDDAAAGNDQDEDMDEDYSDEDDEDDDVMYWPKNAYYDENYFSHTFDAANHRICKCYFCVRHLPH